LIAKNNNAMLPNRITRSNPKYTQLFFGGLRYNIVKFVVGIIVVSGEEGRNEKFFAIGYRDEKMRR